mmetsp:Transcript_9362/g.21645  ORF Transcript_9362/g.21645 Transcript_9362/m.21645 type:complete len:764 (+) Transcript_9362:101-2392(+)
MTPDGACVPPPQLAGTAARVSPASAMRPSGPLVYSRTASPLAFDASTYAADAQFATATVTGIDLNRNGIPDVLEGSTAPYTFDAMVGASQPPAPPRLAAGSRVVPAEEILSSSATRLTGSAPTLRPSHSTGQLPRASTSILGACSPEVIYGGRTGALTPPPALLGSRPAGVMSEAWAPREPVVAVPPTWNRAAYGMPIPPVPPVPCAAPIATPGVNLLAGVPWPPPPLPPVPLDLNARVEALECDTSYGGVDVSVSDTRIKELEMKVAAERAKVANGAVGDPTQGQQWEESMRDLQYQHDDVTREYEQLMRQKRLDEDEKARLLAEFQKLKASRDAEIGDYEDLQRRLQQTEAEANDLRRECEFIRGRLGMGSEWELKHSSIHDEKVRLGTELDHWQSQVDSHGSTVEEWKMKHQNLLNDWERRHEETQIAMQAKHQRIHEEAQQKHDRMDAEWKMKHQEAEREKAQIERDLDQIQADYVAEQQLREEASAKHKQVTADMDQTQKDLNQLQMLCHQHATSKADAERIHAQMVQELRRFEADFQKVQQDVEAEQRARLAAEAKHKAVEADLQKMKSDVDRLRQECDDETKQRDTLQRRYVELSQERALLITDMDKEIAKLQIEADSYKHTRRSSLQYSQSSSLSQLKDLRQRLMEVQQENARLKSECEQVDSDSRGVREEIKTEEDKHSRLQQELGTLKSDVEVYESQGQSYVSSELDVRRSQRTSTMSSIGGGSTKKRVSVNLMDEKVELTMGNTVVDLTGDR